jgi:hypothetical protein
MAARVHLGSLLLTDEAVQRGRENDAQRELKLDLTKVTQI